MCPVEEPALDVPNPDESNNENPGRAARTLASVGEELKVGCAIVTIAGAALKGSAAILKQMKSALANTDVGDDRRAEIQRNLRDFRSQLKNLAYSASVNGTNLLVNPPGASPQEQTVSIVAALARGVSGDITVSAIDVDRSMTALFGAGGLPGLIDRPIEGNDVGIDTFDVPPQADQVRLRRLIAHLDSTIIKINAAASHVSIARSRITLQASFIASLTDAVERESPPPVESGFDRHSAREAALEIRRLLGNQPRSIANLNSQTILKLFPGG